MRALAGVLVTVAAAPLAVTACGAASAPSPRLAAPSASASHAPTVASIAPPPLPAPTASANVATAAQSPTLEWLKELAPRPVTAKKDEFVWATVPTDKGIRFGVYRVLAVDGNEASLLDMLRVRWDHVPGSLILPTAWMEMAALKRDDVVTYADWRGFVGIAVVVSPFPKLRVTFKDASAVVREESANVAQKLESNVAPLAWVMFPRTPDAPAPSKGVIVATFGDRVVVRDEWDQAVVVERARVKLLNVPKRVLKHGEAVLAFTPEDGYRPGTVDRELLPRLAYAVEAAGGTQSYFFSDLALPE